MAAGPADQHLFHPLHPFTPGIQPDQALKVASYLFTYNIYTLHNVSILYIVTLTEEVQILFDRRPESPKMLC